MPEAVPLDIPNRALFKASEVCDLVKLQPYVLRSWEAEFPGLGVAKAAGAGRGGRPPRGRAGGRRPGVPPRAAYEQVPHINPLLLVEGLPLAGARRKLEEEQTPVLAAEPQ